MLVVAVGRGPLVPRKKSIRRAAKRFISYANQISAFLTQTRPYLTQDGASWVHEYAVIRLYREFEALVLGALVGAINNDTSTLSARAGIQFPKHLTDEVCEYVVIGDGFFDFKGRSGLIAKFKEFVPPNHYLVEIVKKSKYQASLEQLSALRNFAAHRSGVSKARAKETVGTLRIGSSGAWLKSGRRWKDLVGMLKQLASEIEDRAPY